MFQYLVTGHDGDAEGAFEHRMAIRPQHLEYAKKLKANGNLLMAGAHLTADEKMNGSTMFLQFETESGIEEYLKTEPYILNRVWKEYKVTPIRVANL